MSVLCGAWLCVFPLHGILAQNEAGAPDFADGFKRLVALGMPALGPDAQWTSANEARESDYQVSQLTRALKGNAWLLPAGEGGARVVPLGSAAIITPQDPAKRPPARDLAKDVETLVASLRKLAAKSDNESSYSDRRQAPGLGCLLLFAAQLHQAGHAEQANELATTVLGLTPNREAVVDAAIDRIAGHFHQEAARSFFASGDWAAYQSALESLIKRYPRGWAAADAVAMLLPQVAKRAAGAQVPEPSLPGVALDPQALAIIRELAGKAAAGAADDGGPAAARRRMMMMGYQQEASFQAPLLWLLGGVSTGGNETKDVSATARLCALKMKALPALAALTGDPSLTHFPNAGYHSSYYSSDEGAEERALRIYASMHRPLSRGEIARQMLAATLPDAQQQLYHADPESLRDLALDFWKQHKGSPPARIAAVFLSEGSQNQISQAAVILAKSSDPDAQRVLETHILGLENAITAIQEVQALLRVRKEAGKPFFEAYAKLVRSQAANAPEGQDVPWMVKQAGGMDKMLKQLEGLLRDQSPRELAMQIAQGGADAAEAAITTLGELLTETPPPEQLAILLDGADAASLGSVRARFITATMGIQWSGENDAETAAPDRQFARSEAAKWRRFLDDKRRIPEESGRMMGGEPMSNIGELAALAFEYSVSPTSPYLLMQAAPVIGRPPGEILRDRALARLAGNAVPPLPDATRVTRERLAAIVAEAAAKPSGDIHPYLGTLHQDERAAWIAWLSEPGEIAIPESVAKLRLKVTGEIKEVRDGLLPVDGLAKIGIGFDLSVESLKNHLKTLAGNIAEHSRTWIYMMTADIGPGIKAGSFKCSMPEKKADVRGSQLGMFYRLMSLLEKDSTANGAIQLRHGSASGGGGDAIWLVENGTLRPADPDKEADGALKEFLETESGRFGIQIMILSKADALKFMEIRSADD